MIFAEHEIYGILSVGVSTFIGQYALTRMDRQDLANVLVTSVEIGGIMFVVYKLVDAVQSVSSIFGL